MIFKVIADLLFVYILKDAKKQGDNYSKGMLFRIWKEKKSELKLKALRFMFGVRRSKEKNLNCRSTYIKEQAFQQVTDFQTKDLGHSSLWLLI